MATTKPKKKTTNELLKPITYKTVEAEEEKDDVVKVLNAAGEKANSLLSNTALTASEDEPTFMPYKPEVEQAATPEEPKEEEGEDEVIIRPVKDLDDLLGAFDDIDKKFENITDSDYFPEDAFKNAIPDSLNLEKYEVPEIDEEAIKKVVSESESAKTEIEKNNLKRENEIKENAINKKIENLKEESVKEKEEIGKIYDDYKVNMESDAIKRGLARSSVAILSLDNIEAARAKELTSVAENLTKAIADAESDIITLQQNLEISLNNLDLELAENINTALSKKIEELAKKRKEAIQFNNEVEKMQADYKSKVVDEKKTASAIEEELKKKYEGAAAEDKLNQKLDIAINYFKTMDKTAALKTIIQTPEIAQALGDEYYALYYYIMRN